MYVTVQSQRIIRSCHAINDIIHCYDITDILIDFAVFQIKWNLHMSIADSLQPTPDITLVHVRLRRRLPFRLR